MAATSSRARTRNRSAVHIWDSGTQRGRSGGLSSPQSARRLRVQPGPRTGRQVATAEQAGVIRLWDFETGLVTRTLTVTIGEMARSTQWALSAFSPDGRCLAVGSSYGSGRSYCRTCDGPGAASGGKVTNEGVDQVLFSPDGTRLASGSWDRTILVWDVFSVPASAPAELAPLWGDLGGEGPTAFVAMRNLLSAGDDAGALIARHIRLPPAGGRCQADCRLDCRSR